MWKRLCILLLFASSLPLAIGCPGKDAGGTPGDGGGSEAVSTEDNGNPADAGGGFKAGVDSGRAEDGSDEDK